MTRYVKGIYRDVLTDSNSRTVWQTPWLGNRIVQGCSRLNAALMKGDEGVRGILYWAVGSGWRRWDGNLPQPTADATQLTREVMRSPMDAKDIVYLDNDGIPTETPTNRVEVTAVFQGSDFSENKPGRRVLREFGLFGGDATNDPNTGVMIDLVIHPRIDMQDDLTLTRKLRLSFGDTVDRPMEPLGFGTQLPVRNIDGIGEAWAKVMAGHGIEVLADLLKVNPWEPMPPIPGVKLVELCAKARLVTGLGIDLAPFEALAELSISTIASANPEELFEMTASDSVTIDAVVNLQQQLAVLQVALDDALLQEINLMDLNIGG
jgi:hypothetical protein